MGYRVGVDVSGTFTDLICVTPDGTVVLDKTPTTIEVTDEQAQAEADAKVDVEGEMIAVDDRPACPGPDWRMRVGRFFR